MSARSAHPIAAGSEHRPQPRASGRPIRHCVYAVIASLDRAIVDKKAHVSIGSMPPICCRPQRFERSLGELLRHVLHLAPVGARIRISSEADAEGGWTIHIGSRPTDHDEAMSATPGNGDPPSRRWSQHRFIPLPDGRLAICHRTARRTSARFRLRDLVHGQGNHSPDWAI